MPVGRALGSHSRGQRFESAYLHQKSKPPVQRVVSLSKKSSLGWAFCCIYGIIDMVMKMFWKVLSRIMRKKDCRICE